MAVSGQKKRHDSPSSECSVQYSFILILHNNPVQKEKKGVCGGGKWQRQVSANWHWIVTKKL